MSRLLRRSTAAVALLLASAIPAGAESLSQALAACYSYSPQLDAARATLRAQDEEVARAHAGFRPTVNGTANYGGEQVATRPHSPSFDGFLHPGAYSLDVQQPLFRGFRLINAVSLAEANTRAQAETLRGTEESVLLDAVTAYMDTVRDTALVKLNESNLQALTETLRSTEERFRVGEVTKTDVAQAQAGREAAVSGLEVAKANLRTSIASFERAIGHHPSNLKEPPDPVRLLPKALSDAVEVSAHESPTVVNALYLEQAARINVDEIWGELLPTLGVEYNYTREFQVSPLINEESIQTFKGNLTWQLYNGGEVEARVRQAKHNQIARLQQIELARTQVRAQVVTAWAKLLASRATLASNEAAVKANQIALAGVREEERVGQRTLLDVINAEQALLQTQTTEVSTRHDLIVNAYTVLQLIGRLDMPNLQIVAMAYDPQVHYEEVRRKPWGIDITRHDGRHEVFEFFDHVLTDRRPPPAK